MFTKSIILTTILVLAIFLRFFQLGTNPPSLAWDEASWGYNAYSLGIDGRDEFGKFLPIQYLESFGDFKPPVYAYLDVIPIKVFGLTEFAVRLPSALFGVLTVFITYFLTKRLFKSTTQHAKSEWIALLAAFFLAIAPWHINLSRAAFEANVATFFLVTGVWLFLKGVQGERWFLSLSIASFVLSMYTFNTARIVAPILVLGLSFGFWRKLFEMKKHVVVAIVTGIVLFGPLFLFLLTPQARLRFHEVNIFSSVEIIERANQEMINDSTLWWSKIIHNRRVAFTIEYLRHYLDHFNPQFLFIKGDGNPKFSTQDIGQMYLWDLPFLVGGILFLLRKREGNWWIIPFWLLIGIIPAATARETPHALRIETTLPTFQIIVAYGTINLIQKFKTPLIYFIFLLLTFNFFYYIHGYYAHYPREYSGEWQYGYRESILYAASVEKDYESIIATNGLGRPYIYYLFYTKTDPATFRKTASIRQDAFGFTHVDSFGKYTFIDNPNKKIDHLKKILYVNMAGLEADKSEVVKRVNILNGTPVLSIYRF